MASAPKLYTRLARPALSAGSYSSLWLAADHLMIVKSNGYSEDYARVELRDVKAFFMTDSERRGWWTATWAVLAGLCAIIVVNTVSGREIPWISGAVLLLFLGGLIWNSVLGAGCRVYVVTGVQTAVLPALVRRKRAERVLARLQPLIAAAQADLVNVAPAASERPPTIAP